MARRVAGAVTRADAESRLGSAYDAEHYARKIRALPISPPTDNLPPSPAFAGDCGCEP